MVQAGIGGLDTPRTNLGDATYLSNQQLDFDISQEQSFQSPSKDNNNIIQQLRNGRRGAINLQTPRSRVALGDRRNLPAGLGGGEFTPLLKSATRNSALRNGKENVPFTPAFSKAGGLDNIPELSPLPVGSSIYGDSRNGSYMAGTPMPQIDSSSTASTPMALLPRRSEGPGVLQDGNQLSLREQENVIDKIEKENFGLKLKIHFLEEALRKAGPGFSEAALKENTELKVDKVTMQKELHRYRKTLTAAERDIELYRQQFLEMQEKVKRKHVDEGQREELERLRQALEEKEAEIAMLKNQENKFEDLEDKVQDLEAELREKARAIDNREDEVDNLKDELEKHVSTISELEEAMKEARLQAVELEEKAQASEDLEDAKKTIQDLEQDLQRLKDDLDDVQENRQEAIQEKERAQADLEELQDEMANKSITTKGLSRQIEEKANRLQDDLEDFREKHVALEEQYSEKLREIKKLQEKIEDFQQNAEVREQKLTDKLELVENEKATLAREKESLSKKLDTMQRELNQKSDEKNLLQIRHDALTGESTSLQRDVAKYRKTIEELEDKLDHEKTLALNNEREIRDEYKDEIGRLNDEIEDLHAEIRDRERVYDDDNDKWDMERRNIESQRDIAEERAAGLQRTIEKLQEAEGTLSSKEMKLQEALHSEKERHESQEAVLTRQITEFNEDVQGRRKALDEVRSELTIVREELRLSQREQKSLAEKVEGLEDEVEILQTSLDDESDQANKEISAAKQESESLRRQLQSLQQDLTRVESEAGEGSKEQLSSRLRDVEAQLARVRQDRQGLQDQLATTNLELHSLRGSKADAEAERDDVKGQLQVFKQQGEDTFPLDQERVDLRTSKIKLDGEVRRLREENKIAVAAQQSMEQELQHEIDRASAEEVRLGSEIRDLQRILRDSSEKRELAAAKKTIKELENRIHELENQITLGDNHADAAHELSIIRQDLSAARQKESEYLQREAAQKDILRGLKRQIMELERKAHETEISRFVSSSPHSSASGSAGKSEIIEVRAQLATAHQTLKDLRAQLKDVEKDAARKVTAANINLQARTTAWESEKDGLERALDQAQFAKEELTAKNAASEAHIIRLRSKVDRLEKALQAERQNSGEDRTMMLERRDLHEMLRDTQLQAEVLEVAVQERENAIAAITATESELRSQLKRVRDERALQRSKAASTQEQLESLERKFRRAKENWETERKNLTRGVRFPNMSLSVNDDSEIATLRHDLEEREKIHVKELRGMSMQIEWLRARCHREENFRAAAAYAKKYMALQIALFEAWYVSLFIVFPTVTRSILILNADTSPAVTKQISNCSKRLWDRKFHPALRKRGRSDRSRRWFVRLLG
jgi:chromosome segregation ATPase